MHALQAAEWFYYLTNRHGSRKENMAAEVVDLRTAVLESFIELWGYH